MKKDLLIVFLRDPELGRVKTRLAATVGNEKALSIYRQLLEHTLRAAAEVSCDKEAWYADGLPTQGTASTNGFIIRAQQGEDLGSRMAYAFDRAFEADLERVVIIGTDCPAMSADLIEQAFSALDHHDSVIGPARDGGYYLLGLKRMADGLFRNKTWSSGSVFSDTIADLDRLGLSYALLPELIDVDTEPDLADVILP